MDQITGWLVGVAVFVLGLIGTGCVVVSVLDSRFAAAMGRVGNRLIERINAVHADVSDLQEEVRFAVLPANEPERETMVVTPKGALEEIEDRMATKLTEGEARVESLVKRVVELEKRGVYDDTDLRAEFDAELRKAREKATEQVEGLRKRTSEKFSLRDGKIEDLQKRVGDLEPARSRKRVA